MYTISIIMIASIIKILITVDKNDAVVQTATTTSFINKQTKHKHLQEEGSETWQVQNNHKKV